MVGEAGAFELASACESVAASEAGGVSELAEAFEGDRVLEAAGVNSTG
jgi:hypothetical protein